VLNAAPGSVHLEVIDAGTAWVLDPTGQARNRLDELGRIPRTIPATDLPPSGAPTADTTETALLRHWEQLATSVDPRLPTGQDWPLLADAISRAHASGYDVDGKLARLAAASPLPERLPARELFWRLTADCQAARPPTRPTARRSEAFVPTHIRRPDERPPSVGPRRGGPEAPGR